MDKSANRHYMLSPYPEKDILFPITIEKFLAEWPINHMLHWHEEIEFIYQLDGHGYYQVGTSELELTAGQAILVNTEELHCTFLPGCQSTGTIYCIGFKADILNSGTIDVFNIKYIEPIIRKQYRLPNAILGQSPWEYDILFHLKRIIEYFSKKPHGYEFVIKSCIYSILSYIIVSNPVEQQEKSNFVSRDAKTDMLKKILKYVHANYDKRISVKDISSEIKMSEAYFSRFFKLMTGQTPTKYINQLRIQKAALLLTDRNRKVMDIAFETGFDSLSYFIKIFKQVKKCTPQEFRHPIDSTRSRKLPKGWNRKHIGTDVKPGSACYKEGVFKIKGSGLDIWNESDEFQFVFVKLEGDCTISARIAHLQNTDAAAKAGVMIRESLEPDSKFAHTLVTPTIGGFLDIRPETKANAYNMAKITGLKAPLYVRLVRQGNKFNSYYSTDGCDWLHMGRTVTLPMNPVIYAGLAVTPHNTNRLEEVVCNAAFDNVTVASHSGRTAKTPDAPIDTSGVSNPQSNS